MNTGTVQGFWHAPNFLLGVLGGAFGQRGRKAYIRAQPPAFQNVNDGIRRAPSSYARLHYYAALSFDFHADDGRRRLCRFRVIPLDGGEESGLPDTQDRQEPWNERRRPQEWKSPDHLRREYHQRLTQQGSIEYQLQIQIHECAPQDTQAIYNIGRAWHPETHPWMDLGRLTLTEPLSSSTTESLRFRVSHLPPALSLPEPLSPIDYRSIGWMRARIYPVVQSWRALLQRTRVSLGLGMPVQWDRPKLAVWKRFRTPRTATFAIPLSSAKHQKVQALLRSSREQWYETLPDITTLHSLRFCVLDADDSEAQPMLMINTVYDGELRDHLDELIFDSSELFGDVLKAVIRGPSSNPHRLREWLLKTSLKENAFYVGAVGQTRSEILENQRLRLRLHDELSAHDGLLRSMDPEAIRQHLLRVILDAAPYEGLPQAPSAALSLLARARAGLDLVYSLANPVSGLLARDILRWVGRRPLQKRVLLGLALIPWGLYTALPTLVILTLIRLLEAREPDAQPAELSPERLAQLEASEDHRLMNNLTFLAPVKGSRLRRMLLRIILNGAERGSRHLWVDGELAGIDTIHFARFLSLDGGRRLLFMSDYDGTWRRYLGDFLGPGSRAVVPIWSNLAGCPKTRWLFKTTPDFASAFLRFTRAQQIEPLLWFCAYPNVSMPNKLSNKALRDGLFQPSMTRDDAQLWLDLLNR
ncbi:catalase [Lujinxingia vulgaris]|uniref:Catalase n=1 Tax=Lujinxingia vulgaris TaxID=2600176 RepID=A0A5C6XL38_9DELT|nr:catalase [Lujinxingia vulgaris]TXD39766.1 catalase [Lujinxingia vulgaris]